MFSGAGSFSSSLLLSLTGKCSLRFDFFRLDSSVSELSSDSYLAGLCLFRGLSVSPAAVPIALSSSAFILALRAFAYVSEIKNILI